MPIGERETAKPGRVLLYSGGLDSYVVAKLWNPNVLLYVSLGQRYAYREIKAIRDLGLDNLVIDHKTLNLFGEEREDGIIPLRNLYLIALASRYGDEIGMGVLDGEINGDKSHRFASYLQATLDECYGESYWCEGRQIRITYPVARYSKVELVRAYLERGFPKDDLLRTVSCYAGTQYHCGHCSACIKRYVALKLNGIEELYESDPHASPYIAELIHRFPTFGEKRRAETLLAFPELKGKVEMLDK